MLYIRSYSNVVCIFLASSPQNQLISPSNRSYFSRSPNAASSASIEMEETVKLVITLWSQKYKTIPLKLSP